MGRSPTEAYKIVVSERGGDLAEGSHTACRTITAIASSGKAESARVLANLRVEPAVRALPERLFFGLVAQGEERTRTIRIVFQS